MGAVSPDQRVRVARLDVREAGRKLICAIADHRWGELGPVEEKDCVLRRSCSRCGAIDPDVHYAHAWGAAEYDGVGCQQYATCSRCPQRKYLGTQHSWQPWTFNSDDISCRKFRRCARDGELQQATSYHRWQSWEHQGKRSCKARRTCSECQRVQVGVDHDRGDPEPDVADECRLIVKCRRCHRIVDGLEGHAWGEWEEAPGEWPLRRRTCRRCGGSQDLDMSEKAEQPTGCNHPYGWGCPECDYF